MVATEHKITKLWVNVQFDDEDDRDLYNGEKDSNLWVSGRMTKQQKVMMTFCFLSRAAKSHQALKKRGGWHTTTKLQASSPYSTSYAPTPTPRCWMNWDKTGVMLERVATY